MMNEETKQHWIRMGIIALITFLVSYLAFFATLKHHLKNMNNPFYQAEKIEKMFDKEVHSFDKYDLMNNPFEPKIRPMMVNLVKEPNEYKVIIDLNQLDDNEDAINISIQNDELTVKGELDKKVHGTEKIIKFIQEHYLYFMM